ncbi:hypothetical protein SprV_0100121000 [Sparganum proliferum]
MVAVVLPLIVAVLGGGVWVQLGMVDGQGVLGVVGMGNSAADVEAIEEVEEEEEEEEEEDGSGGWRVRSVLAAGVGDEAEFDGRQRLV